MFELWNSSLFNADEKTLIRKICFSSTSITLNEEPYNLTPDQAWSRIQQELDTFSNQGLTSKTTYATGADPSFVMYLTAASEFAVMYQWSNEEEFLKAANGNFIKSLEIYKNLTQFAPEETGLLGIAALDLYKAVKKDQYMNFAQKLVKDSSVSNCNSVSGCVSMMYLNWELFNLTKDQGFKDNIKNISSILVENNFDYSGFNGYVHGNKSFYQKGDGLMYTTRDNSLLIPLLIDQ